MSCCCFFKHFSIKQLIFLFAPSPPRAVNSGQVAVAKSTQVKYIEEPVESHFGGGVVAHAVLDEPRIGSESGERYRNIAVFFVQNGTNRG